MKHHDRLDDTHNSMLRKHIKNETKIPELKSRCEDLVQRINDLNKLTDPELGPSGIEERFRLEREVKDLRKQIANYNGGRKSYILKTKNILKQYSEINSMNSVTERGDQDLHNEFKRKLCLDQNYDNMNTKEKYSQNKICSLCNEAMDWVLRDDQYICFTCGIVTNAFPQSDFQRENDQTNFDSETQFVSYEKIDHFSDWLNRLQARGVMVPDDVFNQILLYLRKVKINNMDELDYEVMRTILKKLKLNKFYDQIPIIIKRLKNEPIMVIDFDTEKKLKEMFHFIQKPFYQVKPKERRNFLSYGFVLHKLCQLIDREDIVTCFPLLKSREKLQVQEKIWKKMMVVLEWEYVPTYR